MEERLYTASRRGKVEEVKSILHDHPRIDVN